MWKERNFRNLPKENWCDMDFLCEWIRIKGYQVQTTVENLIVNIIHAYNQACATTKSDFYAVEDNRCYPDNMMVNVADVDAFVRDHGGIAAFE